MHRDDGCFISCRVTEPTNTGGFRAVTIMLLIPGLDATAGTGSPVIILVIAVSRVLMFKLAIDACCTADFAGVGG